MIVAVGWLRCRCFPLKRRPGRQSRSCLVGRGAEIMVSTSRVMTTGQPSRLQREMALFCTRAIFSGATSSPRLPLLNTMASAKAAMASKFCRPSRFSACVSQYGSQPSGDLVRTQGQTSTGKTNAMRKSIRKQPPAPSPFSLPVDVHVPCHDAHIGHVLATEA